MLAYLQNIAVLLCINAVLALTLNFIMGYAGIFSLAHAVFFGVGAYATAYLALHYTDSLLVCMAASAGLTALLSMALALPALRSQPQHPAMLLRRGSERSPLGRVDRVAQPEQVLIFRSF